MPQLAELLIGIEVDSKSAQADLLKLEKTLGVTATRAGAAGQGIDSGFSDVVRSSMRDAGAEARRFGDTMQRELDDVAREAKQATQATSSLGSSLKRMVALVGVGFAARGLFRFGRESIELMAKQEAAENSLRTALDAQGVATESNLDALKRRAAAMQEASVHGDEAIIQAQVLGLNMGVSADRIDQATQTALDMSAALNMDLTTAMRNVAKTTGGYAGELGELIPELKGLSKEQLQAGAGIDLLGRKFSGFAARDVGTTRGALKQLSNSWGDQKEKMGAAFLGASDMATGLASAKERVEQLGPALQGLAGMLGVSVRAISSLVTQLGFLGEQAGNVLAKTIAGQKLELTAPIRAMEEAVQQQADLVEKLRSGDVAGAASELRAALSPEQQAAAMGLGGDDARERLRLQLLQDVTEEHGRATQALVLQRRKIEEADAAIRKFKESGKKAADELAGPGLDTSGMKPPPGGGGGGTGDSAAKALREQLDLLNAAPAARLRVRDAIATVGADLQSQAALVRDLASAIGADQSSVNALFQAGSMGAAEWGRRTGELLREQAALEESTEGLRATAERQARQEKERLETAKQLAEIQARPTGRIDAIGDLGADVRTQASMAKAVFSEIEGDLGKINALFLGGRLEAEEWRAATQQLGAAHDEARAAVERVGEAVAQLNAAEARPEALAALVLQLGDVDHALRQLAISEEEAALRRDVARMATDGLNASERAILETRMAALDLEREAAEAAIEEDLAPQREAEALAALVLQMGELDLARQHQAIAQEEATLRHDLERMAIDGLTAAEEQEIATRMRSIDVMRAQAKQDQALAEANKRTKLATLQKNSAEISGALSSVAAVTKSTKAKIAIQAAQSTISGIVETAKSMASFAEYDPVAGVAHAVSAASFFYAATQAGKGGGAGGGGGGGGGGGNGSAPRDRPGADTFRDVREAEREERGPRYEIAITGTLLGGQPQDVARQIQSYLSQFNEETGGRGGAPVRG